MKFRKKAAAASVNMELGAERSSSNTRISTTFKRSKSFRASSKFISKIRNQPNLRNIETQSQLEVMVKTKSTNKRLNNVEFMKKIYSNNETKEITDLRGIVEDVKNKLSITMKTKAEKHRADQSVITLDSSPRSSDKMANVIDSTKNRHERANVFSSTINEFYSYENPTFDCSFDNSVAGCLYEDEPADCKENNDTENTNNPRINSTDNGEKKIVTILVGNDGGSTESRTNETTMAPPSTARKKTNNHEKLLITRHESFSKNEKSENDRVSGSKSTSWLASRGSNFRFRANNNGCSTESAGLLASGATAVSKFHTFQGMEFLEGFGKKKHQSGNHLPTNINPLTAQPSLNIHVHALFSAVEHGHLDKARTILESTDVDVNSVNSDGLSALDVAVLGSNRSLAKMLVAFGAQEGNRFASSECLGSHLAALLLTAEQRVQELGGTTSGNSIIEVTSCRNDFTSTHGSLTRCADSNDEKQLALWERRVRTLRKMLLGFDQARPPDTPSSVSVDVIGVTSVLVKFQESEIHESSICTKIKVQWSTKEDFTSICGERLVMDMKQREFRIDKLVQGQIYHLRVAAGNIKGWSRYASSTPPHVTPSSWRDLDNKEPRYLDRTDQLEALFSSIRRPEYSNETPALQRRNHKKKTTTIKQLFSATSKFQKSLRRGIYLSCLLYNDDKILVTGEDFLPVIEIDETYSPSCIYNDFHWFMKVSRNWEDVKSLRQDMEKCHGSSSNHLRMKILQATSQMQAALSVQNLGEIYHKTFKDVNGTIVISIVNCIKNPKSVSLLNGRWLPVGKVMKKITSQDNGNNVADLLTSSIHSQMTYHQLSSIKLSRGLYLGYLKMQSSVDHVQVFVPSKAPNVLPHCKIRDNPHVSAEEWEYLKRITRIPACDSSPSKHEEMENATNEGSEQQKLFVDLISATSRRFFAYMNIDHDDSQSHRLYDCEVIELTSQVSLIVVVPSADNACSPPGSREIFHQRDDMLTLPVQVFEMLHLSTYQKEMMIIYSRLSCILELDTALAQQNHREAFSSSEVCAAKERLSKLQDLQCRTNAIWKGARWLIDLITFARDRGNSGQTSTVGISMKNLLGMEDDKKSHNNNGSNGHSLKRSLLQLPPRDPKLVKSSPGRGSWPGPNLSSSSAVSSNLLSTELSKSEQQLPNDRAAAAAAAAVGQYTKKAHYERSNFANNTTTARYNGDTDNPEINGTMTISKSEDAMLLTKYKHSPRSRLGNSLTLVSGGNTSPLSDIKNLGRNYLGVTSASTGLTSAVSDSINSLNNSDDYNYVNTSIVHGKGKSMKPTASVAAVATPSIDCQVDRKKDEATVMPAPLPGILQVYAAYETGLASGTSLKLHVTPRTTAREVVDLVVKQLNMAVVLKGQEGPIYTSDELPNFCLVAVIGARERCLRDDFKPLQLQNPWKKGRLYVRQKQDVLAALEHSSKHTAYL